MSDKPTYTNEDINQLLGLKLQEIPLNEDENNEIVFDEEPNEENEPKRKSLAKNPLAKLALIGVFLGIVFGSIGVFVTVTGNLATLSDLQADKPETKEPEDTGPSEAETLAALKAKAALAGQQDELNRLKAVDEPKEETPPKTTLVSTPPQQPVKAVSTQPPPQPQTVAVRPRSTPKPVIRTSRPSTPKAIQPPSSVPKTVVDPLEQWQTLAQLGSYGGQSSITEQPQPYDQVALVNESTENTSSIIPLTQTVRGTNRVPQRGTRIVAQTQSPQLTEEERFLSGNSSLQQISIGQQAIAVLESSLMWVSSGNQNQNDFVERFVVTLSTPLTNHEGDVMLPTGTPMLVAVRSVHDSGKVTAVVESVVKDGHEIPLPDGAMFLRDSGGNPLMASLVPSGQREHIRANATTFVMGALSRTGELLNQGSTSTFISGNNFTQTQEFNSPNYIGGLLEGGFTPLAERLNQQHENRLSNLDDRTPLWMVEKGTTVVIFVNQTIAF